MVAVAFVASAVAAMQDTFWPTAQSLVVPSALLCVAAIWGYLVAGGRMLNASSIASFGVLLFGGFSGVYFALGLNSAADGSLAPSVLVALAVLFTFEYLLIIFQYRLGLNRDGPRSARIAVGGVCARSLFGLIIFAAGLGASVLGVSLVGAPLAILGIFLTADAFYRVGRVRTAIPGSLILLFLCWLYWEFIFEGFGRLVIGVIACGIVSILAFYFRLRSVKIALLVGTSIALPLLVASRLDFLEQSRGTEPSESEGIGSVVGPLIAFARVIQASWSSKLEQTWGSTYVDAVTLWIPREIWPAKPLGFGADMVPVTQPYRVSTPGFSDAALFGGELVWNFGILGTFMALIAVVLLLTVIDRQYLSDLFLAEDRSALYFRMMMVTLSASALNFVWAGSNLYVGRLQVSLVCLVVLWAVARAGEKYHAPSHGRHARLAEPSFR